jgi:hypothetical protein
MVVPMLKFHELPIPISSVERKARMGFWQATNVGLATENRHNL